MLHCAVVAPGPGASAGTAVLAALASSPGLQARPCESLAAALAQTVQCIFVVVSAQTPLARLLQDMTALHRQTPPTPVLVAVDGGSTDQPAMPLSPQSLDALLDAGARDFVTLPCAAAELALRVRRALGVAAPAPALAASEACGPQVQHPTVQGLIYASPAMARLVTRLLAVARTDASLLIIGETGTGKEVCAQASHYLSPRRAKPWVAVNCGAIPGELVENELFGHVRGAYTTAHQAKAGLVAEAEGGTLFLDDVDCLPLAAQAKLLRFLQEREYRAVGATRTQRADVRVIAASNGDLHALSLRGAFRQDLYYRLNVVRLNVPPLRQRREDITPLALHFMRHFARGYKQPVAALVPAALRRLLAHDWPGNVRELQHVIERAVLLCAGTALCEADIEIETDVAPAAPAPASFREAKLHMVNSFERGYLEQMLAAHGGNVTRAAQASRKDRRAFFELMRKHNIEPARFRGTLD